MSGHKLWDYISWTMVLGVIVLARLDNRTIENIIGGASFAWQFVAIGFVLALAITFLHRRLDRSYFDGGKDRASAILSRVAAITWGTLMVAMYFNCAIPVNQYVEQQALVDQGYSKGSLNKYVFLIINEHRERFRPPVKIFPEIITGNTITVQIGHGKLGYDFIAEFKP